MGTVGHSRARQILESFLCLCPRAHFSGLIILDEGAIFYALALARQRKQQTDQPMYVVVLQMDVCALPEASSTEGQQISTVRKTLRRSTDGGQSA